MKDRLHFPGDSRSWSVVRVIKKYQTELFRIKGVVIWGGPCCVVTLPSGHLSDHVGMCRPTTERRAGRSWSVSVCVAVSKDRFCPVWRCWQGPESSLVASHAYGRLTDNASSATVGPEARVSRQWEERMASPHCPPADGSSGHVASGLVMLTVPQ